MKKLFSLCLCLIMVIGMLAGCGNSAPAATEAPKAEAPAATEAPKAEAPAETEEYVGEPVTLIYSVNAVPTSSHAQGQKEFARVLEEISGGNMKVECYDSGVLYAQDTETEALKNGDVDIIQSGASWLADGSPWISMLDAGYMFQSYEHMDRVMNGEIGKEIFQRIADEQGVLPLSVYFMGARQVSLSEDKHIKTPEDLKGVNLRMPNSESWIMLGTAMGANPTAVNFGDLYMALQTGAVDGQENPMSSVIDAKFYEVQKSISITNHMMAYVWPTINLDTWNSLTDTQKGWVLEATEAGRVLCDSLAIEAESKARATLEAEGLKIYEADIPAFAEHVTQAYLDSDFSNTWDMDLLERIRELA